MFDFILPKGNDVRRERDWIGWGYENLGLFLGVDVMDTINRLNFIRSPVTVAVLVETLSVIFSCSR